MGRPTGSPQNKKFALLFSNVITCSEPSRSSTVASSGDGSIFYIFASCFPECVRLNSRVGLTQLEFNKTLQKIGFPLVRKRKYKPVSSSDFFRPTSFLFANRRWRNPDNEEDLAYLANTWGMLTKEMNTTCTFEGLVVLLRQAIAMDTRCRDLASADNDLGEESDSEASACSTPQKARQNGVVNLDDSAEDETGSCEGDDQSQHSAQGSPLAFAASHPPPMRFPAPPAPTLQMLAAMRPPMFQGPVIRKAVLPNAPCHPIFGPPLEMGRDCPPRMPTAVSKNVPVPSQQPEEPAHLGRRHSWHDADAEQARSRRESVMSEDLFGDAAGGEAHKESTEEHVEETIRILSDRRMSTLSISEDMPDRRTSGEGADGFQRVSSSGSASSHTRMQRRRSSIMLGGDLADSFGRGGRRRSSFFHDSFHSLPFLDENAEKQPLPTAVEEGHVDFHKAAPDDAFADLHRRRPSSCFLAIDLLYERPLLPAVESLH